MRLPCVEAVSESLGHIPRLTNTEMYDGIVQILYQANNHHIKGIL